MAGEPAKHRADRAPRRKQKFADGGSTSGMPYSSSGVMLIPIPQTQMALGRGAPQPSAPPPQEGSLLAPVIISFEVPTGSARPVNETRLEHFLPR
jgi:hypothetical protein